MRWLGVVVAASLAAAGVSHAQNGSREIAFVSNAEGATISLVDVVARSIVGEIDVNPDKLKQTQTTPNYAQDSDVSPDGKTLYVSRGYLGDVAAFDIATGKLKWRTAVDPARSDHMTLSKDGRVLFVSAYGQDRVRRLDTATGALTGEIVAGTRPHDNQITRDGRWLYNSSTGNVGLPVEKGLPAAQASAGSPYQLTIADAQTLKVKARIPFDKGVRPWRFTPDETGIYAQLSNEHAVVAYDLHARRIVRRLELPVGPGVTSTDWVYDAPHHGLSLSEDGKTICIAGRASDYAALVRAPDLTLIATVPVGDSPGWAELADRDRVCIVANTRSDDISFVSVADRKELVRLKTGDGPKHIAVARIPAAVLAGHRP